MKLRFRGPQVQGLASVSLQPGNPLQFPSAFEPRPLYLQHKHNWSHHREVQLNDTALILRRQPVYYFRQTSNE